MRFDLLVSKKQLPYLYYVAYSFSYLSIELNNTKTSVDEKEVTEGVGEMKSLGSNNDSASSMVLSITITHMLGVSVVLWGLLVLF